MATDDAAWNHPKKVHQLNNPIPLRNHGLVENFHINENVLGGV